jgi:hypothetical protein
MSIFEFVLAFTSVISALAIGHLLAGAVQLLRGAARVRFSLTHALWMWSAFAITLGNWASDWELRELTHWPAWTLLLLIVAKTAGYVFCFFVTPDMPKDGELDLRTFHAREGGRYLWAMVVLGCVALAFNFAFGGANLYGPWLRDSVITIGGIAVTLLAIFVRARWVQVGAAAAFALLSTYFLAAVSTLGTT